MRSKQGRIMWVCALGHLPHGVCKHKATIRGLEGSSRKGTKVHIASGTRSLGHRQQDRGLFIVYSLRRHPTNTFTFIT